MVIKSSGASRKSILDALKRADGITATILARDLGITQAAVRLHLDDLTAQGLAEGSPRPAGGRGRPATEWRLTPIARDMFPDHHAELTVELIDAIRAAVGDDGLDRVIEARTRAQEETYRAQVGDGTIRQRVKRLAKIRSDEGYMAEARTDGDDVLLVEHHCPICDAARACQGLCRAELDLFRTVLGDDVEVVREQHLLTAGTRCIYRINAR